MPIVTNPRHEAFAQRKYQGLSNGEAYAKAFNRDNVAQYEYSAGERLMRNAGVLARLAELQERGAEEAGITVERISGMLLDAHNRAVAAKDITNERQCCSDLAKLHGLIIDKKSTHADETVRWIMTDGALSRSQWESQFGASALADNSAEKIKKLENEKLSPEFRLLDGDLVEAD